MEKVILKVEGMTCSACSAGLEKYLNKKPGIKASVNLILAEVIIEYPDNYTVADLEKFISEAGFKSGGVYTGKEDKKNRITPLIVYGFLAILILYISMSHMLNLPSIPYLDMHMYSQNYALSLLILTIPFLFYAQDIFLSGLKNLYHRSPNMDTLVSLGVTTSFLYSLYNLVNIFLYHHPADNLYFESCALIIYFIKLGRFIDHQSKSKTKEALQELVTITPSKALIKTSKGNKEVTLDEIKVGDTLIALPGSKIAVDGHITKGSSHLDETFLTGESLPHLKKEQDEVLAGSLNIDGYIEYQAERIGANSTISEIVNLVVEATNTKAPIAKLADRVSSYFVPAIILIAVISLIVYLLIGADLSMALTTFVTVLVVACPCALGLATPLAIVISTGACAKKGILIKESKILENANHIDTIVFDKTGTLTYGKLQISTTYNYSNLKTQDLLNLLANLESHSAHPIAFAFQKHLTTKLDVTNFQELPGLGLTAKIKRDTYYIGNAKLLNKYHISNSHQQDEENLTKEAASILYLVKNQTILALVGVKDTLRECTKETITNLQKMDRQIILLTGDNPHTAQVIAESLGIKKVIANVFPASKASTIEKLKKDGHCVMMVGDGINDAPSLALADIGVSISSGTDIAANSSDVILLNDDLNNITKLLSISQKALKIIKQNLFLAFFYNSCMIPIAVGLLRPFGLTMNPMIGALAMTMSSLCVVFNSLRLSRF